MPISYCHRREDSTIIGASGHPHRNQAGNGSATNGNVLRMLLRYGRLVTQGFAVIDHSKNGINNVVTQATPTHFPKAPVGLLPPPGPVLNCEVEAQDIAFRTAVHHVDVGFVGAQVSQRFDDISLEFPRASSIVEAPLYSSLRGGVSPLLTRGPPSSTVTQSPPLT